MIMLGIIPRALGPSEVGNFKFITFFFEKFYKSIAIGAHRAFFVFLSADPSDKKLLSFFSTLLLIVFVVSNILLFLIFLFGANTTIWSDIPFEIVILGSVSGFLTFLAIVLRLVNDANGLAFKAEFFYISSSVITAISFLLLYYFSLLSIRTALSLIICTNILLILGNHIFLQRKNHPSLFQISYKSLLCKSMFRRFRKYCGPLFVQSIIGLATVLFERSLLMSYGGSEQQAYFALALALSGFVMFGTTPLLDILTRDISLLKKRKEYDEIRRLLKRSFLATHAISSYLSAFIFIQSNLICVFFFGVQFVETGPLLSLLVFYFLLLSLGQIGSSYFMAIGKTKVIRNISIINSILGAVAITLLLVPSSFNQYGLGANGLIYKMLFFQVLSSFTYLFLVSRNLNYSFLKLSFYKITTTCILIIISYFIYKLRLSHHTTVFIGIMLSGLIYTFLTLLLFFLFPQLLGLSKFNLTSIRTQLTVSS